MPLKVYRTGAKRYHGFTVIMSDPEGPLFGYPYGFESGEPCIRYTECPRKIGTLEGRYDVAAELPLEDVGKIAVALVEIAERNAETRTEVHAAPAKHCEAILKLACTAHGYAPLTEK